jgi:hypothetical protein
MSWKLTFGICKGRMICSASERLLAFNKDNKMELIRNCNNGNYNDKETQRQKYNGTEAWLNGTKLHVFSLKQTSLYERFITLNSDFKTVIFRECSKLEILQSCTHCYAHTLVLGHFNFYSTEANVAM